MMYLLPTAGGGVCKLLLHSSQVEVWYQNDILVLRCANYEAKFVLIDPASNANCNHCYPCAANRHFSQQVSLNLHIYIITRLVTNDKIPHCLTLRLSEFQNPSGFIHNARYTINTQQPIHSATVWY